MNHTYRLVWNRALSMFVAVSECARTRGKPAGGKALGALALVAGLAGLAAPAAHAQSTSFGYDFGRYNLINLWYGSALHNTANEGYFTLNLPDGQVVSAPFYQLTAAKPAGLVDGQNYFYSNGTSLVASGTANSWQGLGVSGLKAGNYSYSVTFLPGFPNTGVWAPDSVIGSSGTFSITDEQLQRGAGAYIDLYNPVYRASYKAPTGSLIFAGGTLQIDTSNAVLAQNMQMGGYANESIDQAGKRATLSGVISDPPMQGFAGSVNFINSGSGGQITLTGQNIYTGDTSIASGASLALAGSGSIASSYQLVDNGMFDISGASGPVTVNNLSGSGQVVLGSGTLRIGNGFATLAGTISGSGGLTVGAAVQTLTGINTYTGATQVDANGTLRLSGSGSIAASGNVLLNGALYLAPTASNSLRSLSGAGTLYLGGSNLALTDAAGAYAGAIVGSGGLTVAHGSETLSGTAVYTGATQVDSGARLALAGLTSLYWSAGLTLNGTLDVSASLAPQALNALSGNGRLVLGSNSMFVKGTNSAFDGIISGSGGFGVSSGKLTLTQASTYTGLTQVSAGATLALTGSAKLNATSSVMASGTFDIAGTNGDQEVGGLGGFGNVVLGSHKLTLNGINTLYGGSISGSGGLTVASGAQAVSGALSYSGATTVAAGATLNVTGLASLNSSGDLRADGTVNFDSFAPAVTLRTLAGARSGRISVPSGGLALSAAAGEFAGVLTGLGGVRVDGGNETLSGANQYSGQTQIAAGATLTLAGTGSMAFSSVLDNGTLVVGSSAPATINNLSGNGAVTLAGQTLVLRQASGNFGGNIMGTGGLTIGAGTQQLSGNNAIAGTVTVNPFATLQVGSSANLGGNAVALSLNNSTLLATGSLATSGALTLAGSATLRANSGALVSLNGAASGSGRLAKTGAGTLALGGENQALSGILSVFEGTLRLASASAGGSGRIELAGGTLQTGADMTLAQNLMFGFGTTINTDAGTTATLSGQLGWFSGSGACLAKTGGGTLNLTGSGALGQGLCVNEGTLRLNGATAAPFVNVAAGATLRGGASIAMPLMVAGTLAPGNSPGTLTSSASVTMLPGSTFQEDINGTGTGTGPGNYARLIVTGSGKFSAGGATLAPNLVNITGADAYTPYQPQLGESYRIVSAAGGLVGRFGNIIQPQGLAPETRLAAFYDLDGTHSIDLRVLPTSYARYLGVNGANRNAQVSGAVLDGLLAASDAGTASALQNQLALTLSSMSGSTVGAAARSLSGEVHGAMAVVAPLAGQALAGTLAHQIDAGRNTGASSFLWADLSGKRTRWQADAWASGIHANRGQLTIGADLGRSDLGRAGIGFASSRASVDASGGSGTLRDNILFAYAQHQLGSVSIDALAGAGRSSWDTERVNPLASGQLRSDLDGRSTLAGAGVSLPWQVGGATLAPFARVLWQRVARDAGGEGSASSALGLDAFSARGVRMSAGVSGALQGGQWQATPYAVQYSAAVGRASGALARPLVGTMLAGVAAEVVAPHASHSFVQGALSGTITHSAHTSSMFGVATELHSGRADLSLNGAVRYSF